MNVDQAVEIIKLIHSIQEGLLVLCIIGGALVGISIGSIFK